jgi:hypothetical protein
MIITGRVLALTPAQVAVAITITALALTPAQVAVAITITVPVRVAATTIVPHTRAPSITQVILVRHRFQHYSHSLESMIQ